MKYPQLADPIWLDNAYSKEKKSTTEIAKIIGCSIRAVGYCLKKFDIKIRSASEACLLAPKKQSKYSLLNDPLWLKNNYIDNKLSTQQIANLIGAKSCNSTRQFLVRHNINIRNKSDGQTINRKDDNFILNLPVIDGSLLGDGSLDIWNNKSNISIPYFHKKNIYYDHILYVANNIFLKNPESRITHYINPKNEKYQYFHISSLTHKTLLPLYNKWYPEKSNYKKVIPEDIEISSELLLNMFMDDGTSFHRRKKSKTKQIIITICSESFTRDNQEMFCEKINKKFNIDIKTTPCSSGTGWRIRVPQSQTNQFYEIIGSCPVPSLSYKWK